jgi:RNA polymerase sigma-70 factor (ECF subfamily)
MKHRSRDGLFRDAVLVHRPYLLRLAGRLTGSRAPAEDLVQETLLKAYRALDRLEPGSSVRPWLLRIMRNTHISEWRHTRRERETLEQAAGDAELVPWLRPERRDGPDWATDRWAGDGLADEVVRALAEVPVHYRTCVLLVDIEQKSYLEAAALTDQPLGTVQSRLFRGRRILQGLLRDYARREGYLAAAA